MILLCILVGLYGTQSRVIGMISSFMAKEAQDLLADLSATLHQ